MNTPAYCWAKTGSVCVASVLNLCRQQHPLWSPWWNFYCRMAAVSTWRSRTISVASRRLAGSSRRFFIWEHRKQKLNMFICFLTRPDGHGYSRMSSRLLYTAHGIIPVGAIPANRDHPASYPGMCERGLRFQLILLDQIDQLHCSILGGGCCAQGEGISSVGYCLLWCVRVNLW